jgi:S-adenosylmethionine synthetase
LREAHTCFLKAVELDSEYEDAQHNLAVLEGRKKTHESTGEIVSTMNLPEAPENHLEDDSHLEESIATTDNELGFGDDFDEDESKVLDKIKHDIKNILIPRLIKKLNNPEVQKLFTDDITYHINPTGKFVIGGPHGDSGLTGRKIIVDTYGGKGAHGGGAFSGKDPSKVDRSGAYGTRHIAKNMVAAGLCEEVLVQVSYAIGVVEPMGLYVNTYGTAKVDMTDGEIAEKISEIFDMRPSAIEKRLKLRNPIYGPTAAYGHMGRKPEVKEVTFENAGQKVTKTVEFFTWEKLDYVDKIKSTFGL